MVKVNHIKKQVVICGSASLFLFACSNVPYQRCDPRILNTWGYWQCGEENVQRYVNEERQTLSILQQEGAELLTQHNSHVIKKQQLRQRLQSLRGETRAIVQKIQSLQLIASRAEQLSAAEQERLVQEIEQTLAAYERNSTKIVAALEDAQEVYNVTDAINEIKSSQQQAQAITNNTVDVLSVAKTAYDVVDTAHQVKTIRDNAKAAWAIRGLSALQKIGRFLRWTIPGIVGGLAADFAIDGIIAWLRK